MTQLIHREGDIFDTDAPAIGHGINVKGVMGAGIAAQFKRRFPEMYEVYREQCLEGNMYPGRSYAWRLDDGRVIYNIASQDSPGANASYEWLITGVQEAMAHARTYGLPTIALPRIGSGIGGLKENLVEGALLTLASLSPIDIELWTYKS